MKWMKKGQEFAHWEERIKEQHIYIFGAGDNGGYLLKNIDSGKVLGFIDNSREKQARDYYGKKVYALEEVKKETALFVIALPLYSDSFSEVKQQLIKKGIDEKSIIHYEQYLHLYFCFLRHSLLILNVNVSVTQKCTLNCVDCSIMTPYLQNKQHYLLEGLKSDADIFFKHIDYVGAFGIVGGEPFLYPELKEYLLHIMQYKKQILRKIQIVTNGTILPSEDILRILCENQVEVSISDYTVTLPYLKDKIEKLLKALKKYQIPCVLNKADVWYDFGYTTVNRASLGEKQMADFFDQCHMPCRLLRGGKLYYCANSIFAIDAGLNSYDPENEVDLTAIVPSRRMEVMEFDEGFNQRGYVNLCRHCNGYRGLNGHCIEVARQA